jgi:hypothetical protein
MTDESQLTESEAAEIVRQFGEGKSNLHSFFTQVIKSKDTIKTGNLTSDELGLPHLPVRTYQELGLFCYDIAGMESFTDYFKGMSEIITSSSLSKDALLLKLSVTIKKELADISPEKKTNSGWFRKKDTPTTQMT